MPYFIAYLTFPSSAASDELELAFTVKARDARTATAGLKEIFKTPNLEVMLEDIEDLDDTPIHDPKRPFILISRGFLR